jgi:hypothetical protein
MYAPYLTPDSPSIDLAVLASSMARELIADWPSSMNTSLCSFKSVRIAAVLRPRVTYVARFDHAGKPWAVRAGDGQYGLRLWFLCRSVGHSHSRIQVLLTTRHPYIRLHTLFYFMFCSPRVAQGSPSPQHTNALVILALGTRFGALLDTSPMF